MALRRDERVQWGESMAYRMGIVGMGRMGGFHAEWIAGNPDMELRAICEKNPARTEALSKQYRVRVHRDYAAFLKEELDFVVVVTTNEAHEELTVGALNSGKNVIVEKPMSVSYDSCRRMIQAAEKNKRHLFVHHSSRWDRDFLLVKETIASSLLGEVLVIQSKVMLCDEGWPGWGIEGMANPWRIKAEHFGGLLFDWGPHLVDQLLLMVDEPLLGVFGHLQSGVWSTEVDDHFFALLKFAGKTLCQIEVSNNGRISLPRWYVIGSKGTLEVKGFKEPFWDQAEITYQREDGKNETRLVKLHDVCESGAEGGFYRDLIPHVEGRKKEFVSMYEAARVVQVLELIKRSSQESRFVEVPAAG
jgi:scyllo-inositol 2-dehydrogenase (NADP+)